MKLNLLPKIAIVLIISIYATAVVNGKSHRVCKTCPHPNIQSAIKVATEYDTIAVEAGKYLTEKIVIQQPITLLGHDSPELISKEGEEIITVISKDVTVAGFIFKDVTISYLEERAAIRVKRGSNFNIFNNKIYNCFFGIYLERAKNGSVMNNEIASEFTDEASSGNAIHAWNCKNLQISNNMVSGHRDGIYFEFVDSSSIRGNHSKNNLRYGLHFMFSNNDAYQENIFSQNGAGVAVMFSRRIDMTRNEFLNNWGRSSYGLLLKEIYDANIHQNTFNNNTIGIFVEGSNRIDYYRNSFRKNGWAIKFAGGSLDNYIHENNFIDNSLDLMVGSSFKENLVESNYWSNYTGYDLDRDGVGDVPYFPVKLFAYILDECPETVVLLRSLFIDLLNFSEKVSPAIAPKTIQDAHPYMIPFS